MSQRGIGDLGRPTKQYRVDLGTNARVSKFEKPGASQREDQHRIRGLRRAASSSPEFVDADSVLALADRLEAAAESGEVHESLASSVYMRSLRINVAGALWKLISERHGQGIRGITIVPRTWEFTPETLDDADPGKLLKALQAALYEQGAAKAKGWFICFIHGEYDPVGRVYRLHVHGFAQGQMVKVFERLRKLPNYETRRYLENGRRSPVYRRVRMSNRSSPVHVKQTTYRLQSYWPARAIIISDDGSQRRVRRRQRLPEPFHSQVLLWMDKWAVGDLTLMKGLRVTKAGLIQTKSVS